MAQLPYSRLIRLAKFLRKYHAKPQVPIKASKPIFWQAIREDRDTGSTSSASQEEDILYRIERAEVNA